MNTSSQTHIPTNVDAAMGRRMLIDSLFKYLMTIGGLSVIISVSAIFFYLASVVVPLFTSPSVDNRQEFSVPGPANQTTLAYSGEEQREIGARSGSQGVITFFNFATGAVLSEVAVPVPAGVQITSAAIGELRSLSQGYGLSDGTVILAKQGFTVTYPDNKRLITPSLDYPLGDKPLAVDPKGQAIRLLGVQETVEGSTIAALTDDKRLLVSAVNISTNVMTGESTSEIQQSEISPAPADIRQLVIESKQRELYVLHGERSLARYNITDKTNPALLETVELAPEGQRVTALTMLSGGFSIIVGTDKGELSQWFLVRTEGANFKLRRIRGFKAMPAAVTALTPEFFRKGFIVGDAQGHLGSYFATSERQLFIDKLSDKALTVLGIPPRGNGYLAQDANGRVFSAAVANHYPEVSWSSLWEKVWYESYEEPDYVWQSSAANGDFEPKFSLAPLTYGTIKAASYAMLISVPLAILGAIFTAYFMTQRMRTIVKPTIEVMEALPTVVLGFLAGLWLAPLVDNNLAGVLLCILLLPASMVLASYVWHVLPESLTSRVAPGWEAALLMPVLIATIWLVFQIGHPIEAFFFGGDMPNWLSNELGISYEQRNSLVVGIAMGFAVTPNIFSIAEDAIFSVPNSLTSGSLALGATPWQTLIGVVLLTASPGIFSAIMIGLGRAVGETMIVLMATGNTAVMDFSLFTGFRTLAANIGVEMPEAGVGETHYRLLFLSALVLFAFTFFFNTIAELVRQRLREKYQTI
ncbi:MAG: ABC transporter permease subunit [Rhodoferax sp.]|nr:ABC transporter permease subunit [Betaproteobacteria bacterium]NCN96534.1 ABC transporter permease subunit [Rhodoferax sp.]OIP19051.1 MAG: phosphate ABC transporter permease [Comamonadaceae bacterium CG2_30_57_122]PIZ22702.1 MAG: phosphate ABC transporter permease [Comamonadaceae bacterium CG_4_10_14_0_8_um_filter_57_29]PJC21001.1 MAG: phosphate ABC transporter permease [Comamonadaceae bacterium CG_4_9_14_0_8_um_filter_57_21]